ncbi:hypothetical protein [Lelliottia nimipressuralis]|jgi:hypothetical protein|uniref:hypothetical protein n=1 Tax=Lelliottia nimipressuralis TaxID=69220 RepID=UPI003D1CAAAF
MKMRIAVLILLTFASIAKADTLTGECWSKFRVHTLQPSGQENLMVLDLAIQFIKSDEMIFFMEGGVVVADKKYNIARYLTFSYSKLGDDYYSLQRISVQRLHSDNYDADDLAANFGLHDSAPKFHITTLSNNYIFANEFAPLLICTR